VWIDVVDVSFQIAAGYQQVDPLHERKPASFSGGNLTCENRGRHDLVDQRSAGEQGQGKGQKGQIRDVRRPQDTQIHQRAVQVAFDA
jgi:hypothetical protein